VLAVPGAAAAQRPAGAPETGVQIEQKQRRPIVVPPPDAQAVERDVDQAIRARRDAEALTRRAVEDATGQSRRPDLSHDVTGGIQTRSLNRAR